MLNIINEYEKASEDLYEILFTRVTTMKWQTVLGTGHDVGKLELAYISERNVQMVHTFWKTMWQFFKKYYRNLPHKIPIPFLGSKKNKNI